MNRVVIFFDLETTGLLDTQPDIVQIGAVSQDGLNTFDEFLAPSKAITAGAAQITGLHIAGGQLLSGDGRRIHARPPQEALQMLVNWLKQMGSNCVLCAYNGIKFDAEVLVGAFRRYNIDADSAIAAFVDPFVYLKNVKSHLAGKGLHDLATRLNINTSDQLAAHNAIADAQMLRQICLKLGHPGLFVPNANHFAPFNAF